MSKPFLTLAEVRADLARQKAQRNKRNRVIAYMHNHPNATYVEAAKQLGCSDTYVSNVMLSLGIRRGYTHQPMVGTTFGKWEVISDVVEIEWNHAKWMCRCECGTEKWVRANNIVQGTSTNCGCVFTSPEFIEKKSKVLRDSWTPEKRKALSDKMKAIIADSKSE